MLTFIFFKIHYYYLNFSWIVEKLLDHGNGKPKTRSWPKGGFSGEIRAQLIYTHYRNYSLLRIIVLCKRYWFLVNVVDFLVNLHHIRCISRLFTCELWWIWCLSLQSESRFYFQCCQLRLPLGYIGLFSIYMRIDVLNLASI